MLEKAIEILKIFESNGYTAYIVGGFVRDYIMKIQSHDIDITTNATPQELKNIFTNVKFPKNMNDQDCYGSVSIIYKNILFSFSITI